MITKIIDKRVVFEGPTVIKDESGIDTLYFEINRFYKTVDLNLLTPYFKFLRSDGYDDKVVMKKAFKDETQKEIIISVEVDSSMTRLKGDLTCEISFESTDGKLFNSEVFYLQVENSITGIDGIVLDEEKKILQDYLKIFKS